MASWFESWIGNRDPGHTREASRRMFCLLNNVNLKKRLCGDAADVSTSVTLGNAVDCWSGRTNPALLTGYRTPSRLTRSWLLRLGHRAPARSHGRGRARNGVYLSSIGHNIPFKPRVRVFLLATGPRRYKNMLGLGPERSWRYPCPDVLHSKNGTCRCGL
jgi:hypothetical protein